ncbi:phenylphosphate carboxylase subunit gamma [Aromatoleum aromaticum]|uniref:Phenylphosphate carboxylase, delta subunit n=1 Tax=Aromatoleum aromaticum (strain DSM 19018 / LMG 30748 / EbN1) TaxID=76114 RepID=Q5P481_AROAE|nr:phenylphosphate carboxylase subunit gamma [Aromatoleum aromaticum]NMG53785.1 phenylphosphate carboxylase subunit gamma [Aromatoleum aromaticum]CAI07882.1 Phenylphosphate carboxylase, delta subunit [Aromatoleum aromaticum EbN1]
MNQWEVFVMDLAELPEGTELELSVRTLNPGLKKYTYQRVKAELSNALDKFPDRLQVRFGRGQLCSQQFSIRIIEQVQRMPAKYL